MFENKTTFRVFFALASLAWLAAAGPAAAADYPQRLAHEELSRSQGFDPPRLPLLERVPGPGKGAVTEELLARFTAGGGSITTAGTLTQDVDASRVAVTSDAGWALKVYADGSRLSYRNFALLEDRSELALPLAERPTESELEFLGRAFVEGYLDGLVTTAAGEELVPFFTEFALRGGMAVDGSGEVEEDRVTASAVVFTRTVGGVPVVGPGSKVAVIFTNDGQPVGFDLDWPQYQSRGDDQELLDLDGILARSQVMAELDGFPEEAVIEHLECGYYDAGARRDDPVAPIQAGCFLQAKQRRIVDPEAHAIDPGSGHVLVAKAEAIPAGAEVAADEGWPEVMALLGQPAGEGGLPGESPPAP